MASNISKPIHINQTFTGEELELLEMARNKDIVFDDECPETTPERALKFRRVNNTKAMAG